VDHDHGFVLLGVGMVALGAGLAGALKGRSATVGSILVVVAGVGIIVAGLARNDCSSQLDACDDRVEAGDVSWHHATHDLVSLVVFLALVAAALVLARALRGDQSWRDLRTYCLITAVLGFVLLVGFITAVAGSWNGLLQRVFVTVLFLWIAVLSARLKKRNLGPVRGQRPQTRMSPLDVLISRIRALMPMTALFRQGVLSSCRRRHEMGPRPSEGAHLDDAVLDSVRDGRGTRVDTELGEDVGHVAMDRALAEVQFVGDRTVGLASGDEAEDLDLPSGEPVCVCTGVRGRDDPVQLSQIRTRAEPFEGLPGR
jgi:hypothetical protein